MAMFVKFEKTTLFMGTSNINEAKENFLIIVCLFNEGTLAMITTYFFLIRISYVTLSGNKSDR